jgi:hypothetical protein
MEKIRNGTRIESGSMPNPSSGSVPRSHSTGIKAAASATRVSFTSLTNAHMSRSVIAKATPKKTITPRAPSRMSPTALAKPMIATDCPSPEYFARRASSRFAKSK